MQRGKDDLHSRHFFLRMNIDRNTATVVTDLCGAVFVQDYFDVLGETRQTFVGSIIDDLDQRVIRVHRVGVHARAMQNR